MDGVDQGLWYGMIGHLLGNETLVVSTHLVGPDLFKDYHAEQFASPQPILTGAAGHLASLGFSVAALHPGSLGEFLKKPEASTIDLFVMFHPGFESHAEWFEQDQLHALCAKGKPIAVSSYITSERLHDSYLCKLHGFRSLEESVTNPFRVRETPNGAWADQLWSLLPEPPETGFSPDTAALARVRDFAHAADIYFKAAGQLPPENTGTLCTVTNEAGAPEHVVRLPGTKTRQNLAVSLDTGEILEIRANRVVETNLPFTLPLPDELLSTYPVDEFFDFRHIMWAMEAFAWFANNELDDEDLEEYDPGGLGFDQLLEDLSQVRGNGRFDDKVLTD
jgi:hypothetical protein